MNRKERRRHEKSRRKTGAAKANAMPVFEQAYQHQQSGRFDAAIAGYQQVLAIDPNHAASHCNLGSILMQTGQAFAAMENFRKAVRLEPRNKLYWAGLAASLRPISFTSVDDGLLKDLSGVLAQTTVDPLLVTRAILSALRQHPPFSRIVSAMPPDDQGDAMDYHVVAGALSDITLFLSLLKSVPINDPDLEGVLVRLRQAMMVSVMAGQGSPRTLPFSTALALQCFFTEYVYEETPEESDSVDRLRQELVRLLKNGEDIPPEKIAAFAAYRPLHGLPGAGELRAHGRPKEIAELIQVQVAEFLEEQALRPRIQSLTPIDDSVSKAVREQYEENPYPRWIKTVVSDRPQSLGEIMRTYQVPLKLTDNQLPECRNILIAGCGTGKSVALTASRFPQAHILAMDLSTSSLAYAMRKTREAGFSNIEYRQGDILQLSTLEDRRFDYIDCTGVLHHMGDPMAGWRTLRNILGSGGLMRVGLYSETARRTVVRLRDYISGRGFTSSAGDIRRCRSEIVAMAESDPEMAAIAHGSDFASLSACRDLLFHVQEHRFNLPRIEAALLDLGLDFLGFELHDRSVLPKFRAFIPQDNDPLSLAQWHQFETAYNDTFAGMYLFWARRPVASD